MIIFPVVISVFFGISSSAHASEATDCTSALIAYIESKGCEASVDLMRESGIQTISCAQVPVFVSINDNVLEKWIEGKTAEDLSREIVYALSPPKGVKTSPAEVSAIWENAICIDDTTHWSQVRKTVPIQRAD